MGYIRPSKMRNYCLRERTWGNKKIFSLVPPAPSQHHDLTHLCLAGSKSKGRGRPELTLRAFGGKADAQNVHFPDVTQSKGAGNSCPNSQVGLWVELAAWPPSCARLTPHPSPSLSSGGSSLFCCPVHSLAPNLSFSSLSPLPRQASQALSLPT